jgi:hypothetical protein
MKVSTEINQCNTKGEKNKEFELPIAKGSTEGSETPLIEVLALNAIESRSGLEGGRCPLVNTRRARGLLGSERGDIERVKSSASVGAGEGLRSGHRGKRECIESSVKGVGESDREREREAVSPREVRQSERTEGKEKKGSGPRERESD